MSDSSRKEGPFPALASSSFWRYFVFTMLYVAQGIPIGVLLYAVPAYMANNGVEAAVIGAYGGLAILPHSIKLFLGPVMDRWTYLPMGRRRPWVIFAQFGIIISFASLAFIPDPLANIPLLMAGAFLVNFFVAFQDVSVDGMAVDILHPDEQSQAAALMFGGQSLGVALTTAVGAYLLNASGIAFASLACSSLVILIILLPLFSRERTGEKLFPWTAGKATETAAGSRPEGWIDIIVSVFRYFFMGTSLVFVAAIAFYTIGRGLHMALVPVYFIQELGWEDTEFSYLTSIASFIGAVVTMTIGGPLVHKVGRINFFAIACIAIAGIGLSMAVLPFIAASKELLYAYRIVYATLDTLTVVSIISVAMAVCGRKVAATQFAIYMAISNLGLSGGQTLIGPLREQFSDTQLFLMFSGLTFTALFIMRVVQVDKHAAKLEGMDMVAN